MAAPDDLMKGLYRAVEGYVKTAFDALTARLDDLDARMRSTPVPARGEKGEPGRNADPSEVRALISELVADAVAKIPTPRDGRDADDALILGRLEPLMRSALDAAIAALPKPRDGVDGEDADLEVVLAEARAEMRRAFEELPKPRDGKDADMPALIAAIREEASRAVAALPVPKDGVPGAAGRNGKDVDMEAAKALIHNLVENAISAIPKPRDGEAGAPGKDGRDGKDVDERAVRELVGGLVEKAIATVQPPRDGKDGKDGKDGRDVDHVALSGLITEAVAKAVAALPRAQDGRDAAQINPLPGIDPERSYAAGTWATHAKGTWLAERQTKGMDGWRCVMNGVASVEHMQVGERGFMLKTTQSDGTVVSSAFVLPVVLDAGIWRPEAKYEKGDGVTYGGSFWIAQIDDPKQKPGFDPPPGSSEPQEWRLSVKKGRDGRDAETPKPSPGKIKAAP